MLEGRSRPVMYVCKINIWDSSLIVQILLPKFRDQDDLDYRREPQQRSLSEFRIVDVWGFYTIVI